MASPRKSSIALAARERARAQAEEIIRRNELLIELATQFFVQEDRLAEIDADLERKIQSLRKQSDEKKRSAREESCEIVQQMINTGESKKSISERLGLTSGELKRYATHTSTDSESKNSESSAKHAPEDISKSPKPR